MVSDQMTTMLIMALYMFVLYYLTVPKAHGGPLLNIPSDTSNSKTLNIAHGIIFTALFMLTSKYVVKMAGGAM